MKFALGIIQLGLGFLITMVGQQFVNDAFAVPLFTLVLLYMLHTTGELFLSPIGLSMVTKLAPKHMTGTAMGGWFLSFAIGNYTAALIAKLTGSGGHEGGDTAGEAVSAAQGLSTYIDVFSNIGLVIVGIGLLVALLAKPLNKLMHGIR